MCILREIQRADFVRRELDKLYPTVPIFLHHTDAYTLLVAVALSAQTTDKKVNEITPELFRVAGTPQAMARLEVAEIKDLIKEKIFKDYLYNKPVTYLPYDVLD